ncbi:response regulator transcription factor, partial [Arthrospira platensis SPKY2]
FEVTALEDGEALRAALRAGPSPDVVIMDLGLPGEDGLSLTRFLREHHDAGILIASGKGATVDRVIGLEVGADDYLAKPFDLRELLARVRSLIRRTRVHPERSKHNDETASEEVRDFAGWRIDLASRRLFDQTGEEIELST